MKVFLFGTAFAASLLGSVQFAAPVSADPDDDALVTSADQQTMTVGQMRTLVCQGKFQTSSLCAQEVQLTPERFWLGGTPRDSQLVTDGSGQSVVLGDLQHAFCDSKTSQIFAECAEAVAANPGGYQLKPAQSY